MNHDEFYNSFSSFYDEMTRFDFRLKNEKDFFFRLKTKHHFSKAVDIGCGSGAHSFILSECGAEVTGIDPSKGMIEKALLHLSGENNIKFINSSLENFAKENDIQFDAAFFMGNSLPHLTDKNSLELFLISLKKILLPGALFTIQILNYVKILDKKERIINIRETDNKIFVRFYDFISGSDINFNILTISGNQNKRDHDLITTRLFAYTYDNLIKIFPSFGFEPLDIFGNMKMESYDRTCSPNLIMTFKNNL